MERTAILIPAFNAADTLPDLLQRLQKYVHAEDVIVVDDGSTDNTANVARGYKVRVLQHDRNYGKGRALRTGFDHVTRSSNYDAVVTMDADLQHRPEELPLFISLRESQGFDLIIGCRERWGTAMPLHRKLSNTITSSLVAARTGIAVKDSQCGYRLIARSVLQSVRTGSDGYEAETELLIKAARQGFRLAFVPIKTVYANEKSSMTNFRTTLRFLNVLLKEY